MPSMSTNEKERITEVFKMYETDVRSAAMNPEVSWNYIWKISAWFFLNYIIYHGQYPTTFKYWKLADFGTTVFPSNKFQMICMLF